MRSYLINLFARNILPASQAEDSAWLKPRLPSRFEPAVPVGTMEAIASIQAEPPVAQPGVMSSSHMTPPIGRTESTIQADSRSILPDSYNDGLTQEPAPHHWHMRNPEGIIDDQPAGRSHRNEPAAEQAEWVQTPPVARLIENRDYAISNPQRLLNELPQPPVSPSDLITPRHALPLSPDIQIRAGGFGNELALSQKSPELPPSIQVTIGRVEVRANPPQAARPRLPSKPSGLDDYLKRRGKGR